MIDQSANADALHWRFSFLQTLRETGKVSAAARHVGRSRAAVCRARKQDDRFAAEWDDALEEAADWLELEALRRAVDGTEEGRYFQGEMIGTITRYSDSLLMFLLKARRPQLYGGLRQTTSDDGERDIERLRNELETKMARLVAAEAGGQSWLQRNWRPLTMLCFLFLVMADSFGLLAFRLSAEAWGLLQNGLGGYVVGRSVEKIAPQIKSSLNSKRV